MPHIFNFFLSTIWESYIPFRFLKVVFSILDFEDILLALLKKIVFKVVKIQHEQFNVVKNTSAAELYYILFGQFFCSASSDYPAEQPLPT